MVTVSRGGCSQIQEPSDEKAWESQKVILRSKVRGTTINTVGGVMVRRDPKGWEVGVSIIALNSLREVRFWSRKFLPTPVEEYGKMVAMTQAFGHEDPLPDIICTNEFGLSVGFGPACGLGMTLRVPCFGVSTNHPHREKTMLRKRGESKRDSEVTMICPHPGHLLFGDVGWGLSLWDVETWVLKTTSGSSEPLPLHLLVKRGWSF